MAALERNRPELRRAIPGTDAEVLARTEVRARRKVRPDGRDTPALRERGGAARPGRLMLRALVLAAFLPAAAAEPTAGPRGWRADYTVCEPAASDLRLFSGTTRRAMGPLRPARRGAPRARPAPRRRNERRDVPRRPQCGRLLRGIGEEVAPLVTREGPGNFGLLPNGVLCLSDASAAILETRASTRRGRPAATRRSRVRCWSSTASCIRAS